MCEIFDPARASIRYGAALLLVKATPVSWQTCKSHFRPIMHAHMGMTMAQDIFGQASAGPRMLLEAR